MFLGAMGIPTTILHGKAIWRNNLPMKTIDLTPSWSALMPVMVAVLRNPEASQDAVETIEGELMRLANHVDQMQEENK